MNFLRRKWDEIALLILAFEAVAWLISEIFLLRLVGYPVVILAMVAFFVHTLAIFRDDSNDSAETTDDQANPLQQA